MRGTILFGIDVETASPNSVGLAEYGGELFRELDAPVTWFLTGRTLERYPDVFREIETCELIELQAHTYDHVLLKTILMRVPEGRRIHGSTDWYLHRGGSLGEIDADLARCQRVFSDVLGRRATGLTGPWGYYRGLGDRPELLDLVRGHGFRILRTFARDEHDAQPVPLDWQPFFYELQGFPDVLECLVHGYQDDFYWRAFEEPEEGESYVTYLKTLADRTAKEDLAWSLCSHDHGCATKEGFEQKGSWMRAIVEYAKGLGVRFMTVSRYYEEMRAKRNA